MDIIYVCISIYQCKWSCIVLLLVACMFFHSQCFGCVTAHQLNWQRACYIGIVRSFVLVCLSGLLVYKQRSKMCVGEAWFACFVADLCLRH